MSGCKSLRVSVRVEFVKACLWLLLQLVAQMAVYLIGFKCTPKSGTQYKLVRGLPCVPCAPALRFCTHLAALCLVHRLLTSVLAQTYRQRAK